MHSAKSGRTCCGRRSPVIAVMVVRNDVTVVSSLANHAAEDVRRLPTESEQEVCSRLRGIIADPAVTVEEAGGQRMPSTEPSSLTSALYRTMEQVFGVSHPRARVLPLMMRGGTDGAFPRAKL